MPELLVELFSEEIPARMQARAEADLAKALTAAFDKAELTYSAVDAWSGPRRLGVRIDGVDATSADVREERKGPKTSAPEKAIAGFLRGAGLESIDQAEVRSDPKKGDFYIAIIERPGQAASDIIAQALPEIIQTFHWPKSMRTGTGELRWVRPLQRIICLFDGQTVPLSVDGIASGNTTEGHRVHGRGPYEVKDFATYRDALEGAGHVMLTREARRDKIAKDAIAVCADRGLELVSDPGLLEEVTGLVEWPYVILGDMDPAFLNLPPEVIQLSMRTHQKYFAVTDPKTGTLAPHFVVVANLTPADGGGRIAAGNARVLSARLDDARFFWDNDKKTGLDAMVPKLSTIAFKARLGSLGDKVERVVRLAGTLAAYTGADVAQTQRAAALAKADLVSDMVYEFPELQGVMGRYYALEAGEAPAVANAIGAHYQPQGPSDDVPTDPVAVTLALADKFDTLVGFWTIDEKPTGSKDPFALRRAALGIVRLLVENRQRLPLGAAIAAATFNVEGGELDVDDLKAFFADRLKQVLRDGGQRHDLIDAIFALGEDDLVRIVLRVEALSGFLGSEDGANLLAGYRRAANILRAEEKKEGAPISGGPEADLFAAEVEHALHTRILNARDATERALADEDFEAAMTALAQLRAPVDAFFEDVMVNDSDAKIRINRLRLLAAMRDALHQVADFSKIES